MWVDERCTIVTSAPLSHSAAQMSWAELLEPMTTTVLARVGVGSGMLRSCGAARRAKRSAPGICGTFGLPGQPVASTRCCGRSVTSSPSRSTTTVHC